MKKRIIRLILILVCVVLILAAVSLALYCRANRTNGTLLSSGEERRYLLYVPDSYNPNQATPLVISLHGFAEWPDHLRQTTRWNDLADEHGFIVVYPSGTRFPLRWRTHETTAGRDNLHYDVTYISDLIDELSATYNIDPQRIYVNGLSNGGGLSFTLSCMLSDRIAAFGSVAGAYALSWEDCQPIRQVPAIIFHGTNDQIVPFDGGVSGPSEFTLPDIQEWVETLAARNGCDPTIQRFPPMGEVTGIRYRYGTADVILYIVRNGGHSWPGGKPIPEFIVGHTTQDIDSTREMWKFFIQHPLTEKGGS